MLVSLLEATTSPITSIEQLWTLVTSIITGMVGQLNTLLNAITSHPFYMIPFAMALVGLAIRFFFKLFGR